MFQVRFHGRGGQGLVTAAELLAAASTGSKSRAPARSLPVGDVRAQRRVLYICYDNQAYMDTGVQRSGATPPAARTATTQAVGPEPGNHGGRARAGQPRRSGPSRATTSARARTCR
jgi:hypothetical protein